MHVIPHRQKRNIFPNSYGHCFVWMKCVLLHPDIVCFVLANTQNWCLVVHQLGRDICDVLCEQNCNCCSPNTNALISAMSWYVWPSYINNTPAVLLVRPTPYGVALVVQSDYWWVIVLSDNHSWIASPTQMLYNTLDLFYFSVVSQKSQNNAPIYSRHSCEWIRCLH